MIIVKGKIQDIKNNLSLLLSQLKNICVTNFSILPNQINKITVGEDKLFSYFNRSVQEITEDDLKFVTKIGVEAFSCCTSLKSVTIPDSVTNIGGSAFYMCTSLTSVTIPNSVTNIDGNAFEYCSSLTSVTIPNSVTNIGGSAFHGCMRLISVTIGNSVTSIGSDAFNSCTNLASVTIPDSVTSIGKKAFTYCTSLTSVTIGNSVTSIGDEAFYMCTSLTDMYLFPTAPPTLVNTSAISSATTSIHVPVGSGDTYKTATNWSTFADKIVEDIVIE